MRVPQADSSACCRSLVPASLQAQLRISFAAVMIPEGMLTLYAMAQYRGCGPVLYVSLRALSWM
jgi:hypothetical protein